MSITPTFAEEAVLGSLLQANDRLHDVQTILDAGQFTSRARSELFSIIRDRVLAGEPADAVTVGEANPDLFEFACSLAATQPGSSQVMVYAGIVRENWRRREAMNIALNLQSAAKAGEDGAVDEAIAALLKLNSTVTLCEYTGKQAMQQAWRAVEAAHASGGKLPGITLGLSALDDILGGLHNSDLTVVGGRPAMGKTAFLGGLVEAAANAGFRPGVISAEQPAVQMALRRLSMVSSVPASRLRSGQFEDEDWARMTSGMAKALTRDLWIYDRSAVTLDELIGIARKWKHSHDIGALYIDYAQRIKVPGCRDRIQEVSEVAIGMKNLARDLNIPVVALAQVKAAVEGRPDKRPNAGDLANSDELTREADQIVMLYRDEVYNRDSPDKGVAEVLIEKNRHGPTGFKKVAFLQETMRFADLGRDF